MRPDVRPLLPPPAGPDRAELDEALLMLAERLLEAGTPHEVASTLVEAVVTTYGFPRATVVGRVSGLLSALAVHAPVEAAPGLGSSASVEAAHEQLATQVVPHLEAAAEPWLTRLLPVGADVLVVPLGTQGHSLGALVLQVPITLQGAEGRRMLAEVERGARYAGLALHRVQRLAQLQRLAATDDLTMIANRRSFLASLEREVARSVRRGEPVSLVLLDLDHFKQVNDIHGHPAGDEALRNVAAALTITCRDLDTAARYGGEEFVVILPDCDAERSVDIADRFRSAIRAAPAARRLTASAGVATFPTHAREVEQLIQAADDALLEAKRRGRDCTVMSTGDVPREEAAGARARETPPG